MIHALLRVELQRFNLFYLDTSGPTLGSLASIHGVDEARHGRRVVRCKSTRASWSDRRPVSVSTWRKP
jgi:hypothetical protein